MDGRLTNREVLLRRVTCSDLIGARNSTHRQSVPSSVSSNSGSINQSLAASCEPSVFEGLNQDQPSHRKADETGVCKNSDPPIAVRSRDSSDRRNGKERRSLVKMTSAVSLLRKVTATVQKHAVQLSYDYAPPPSLLYGDMYRSCAYSHFQRPTEVAAAEANGLNPPKQKTSFSTSELSQQPTTSSNMHRKPSLVGSVRSSWSRLAKLSPEYSLKSKVNSVADQFRCLDLESDVDGKTRPRNRHLMHRRSEPRICISSRRLSSSTEPPSISSRAARRDRERERDKGDERRRASTERAASAGDEQSAISATQAEAASIRTFSCSTASHQQPISSNSCAAEVEDLDVFQYSNRVDEKVDANANANADIVTTVSSEAQIGAIHENAADGDCESEDCEIDIAQLGDALQSHLRALMRCSRNSECSNDSQVALANATTTAAVNSIATAVAIPTIATCSSNSSSFRPASMEPVEKPVKRNSQASMPVYASTPKFEAIAGQSDHSPDADINCTWTLFRTHKRKTSAYI